MYKNEFAGFQMLILLTYQIAPFSDKFSLYKEHNDAWNSYIALCSSLIYFMKSITNEQTYSDATAMNIVGLQ